MAEHQLRRANKKESQEDCCGDRALVSNVAFVCSCGERACRACMESHLLEDKFPKERTKEFRGYNSKRPWMLR